MKIFGGPHVSMNDARKGKHPVWSALIVATLVSAVFVVFLPFILYAVMIAMIPGISDLAWGIAQFPVKLLSLPLPASDSAGYTFNVAGRIYAAQGCLIRVRLQTLRFERLGISLSTMALVRSVRPRNVVLAEIAGLTTV